MSITFILSLRHDGWQRTLHLGWRAGRENSKMDDRGVKFLLAAPRDFNNRYLAYVHVFFLVSIRRLLGPC